MLRRLPAAGDGRVCGCGCGDSYGHGCRAGRRRVCYRCQMVAVATSTTAASLPGVALFDRLAANAWAYPALEVVHIAGIALLVGSLVLFELRVWGVAAALPAADLARLALGTALAGFGLAAASGLTMFATQPAELLANPAFRFKLALLLLAGANAVLFHARGGVARLDRTARWQGLLSLVVWLGVIACGRSIAYV